MAEHRETVVRTDPVVVTAANVSERLEATAGEHPKFVTFMQSLNVNGLDLTRDGDTGRDVTLRPAGC